MTDIRLPGVPEGYRLVCFGCPKKGESHIGRSGRIQLAGCDFEQRQELIVRKIYKPPEWLKNGFIFKRRLDSHWVWCKNHKDRRPLGNYLDLSMTNFVGPDVDPEDSLIEINRKGGAA